MSDGWIEGTLADVLTSISNGVNKSVSRGKGDGEFKISRIETIASGKIDIERVGHGDLTPIQANKYRLDVGDILFSHINSPSHVGKSAIYSTNVGLMHGTNLLRLVPSEAIDPKYLHYALVSLYGSGYWRTVANQAVNQASVNQGHVLSVPISYPASLDEQKRIVAKLDALNSEADRLIDLSEKISIEARQLVISQTRSLLREAT